MRNIQFSSPVDALWQENEFAKNALLASHVVSSESSNVYTGTPYSGWGPGIDTLQHLTVKAGLTVSGSQKWTGPQRNTIYGPAR